MMNLGMMNPYMMGTDMMMGGFYYNPAMQINYMNQMDQFAVNRQVNMYRNQNNAQYQMSAQTDGIAKQVQILSEFAKSGNQNGIKSAYDNLVSAVKVTYGTQIQGGTAEEREAQARAYAERIYTQQTGSMLTGDIRANAGGSFLEGFKRVVTFGTQDKITSEENIAFINGTKVRNSDKSKKYLGYAAGGTTLAVGAALLYKYSRPIAKAFGAIAKFLFTKA